MAGFQWKSAETRAAYMARRDAERAEQRASLRARLAEAAERDGPGSIMADLLAEHDARHAQEGAE